MFIKIKAQSSDFENQYIRDRNIFKKKRNGSKVIFSALLLAATGGYFYYLNSGDSLQINQATVASTDAKNEATDILNAVKESQAANNSESDPQSQLITQAIANDQPQETDTEITIVESETEEETLVREENSQNEVLAKDLKNTQEQANESLITDEESDIEVDAESVESITDHNDDVIDLDETTVELTALNSSSDNELDYDDSTQTDNLPTPVTEDNAPTPVTEDNAPTPVTEEVANSENNESLLAQEQSDTPVIQSTHKNNFATQTEKAITDIAEANEQIEVLQTENSPVAEHAREALDSTQFDQTEKLVTVIEESKSNSELESGNTTKQLLEAAQDIQDTKEEINFDSDEKVSIVKDIESNTEDPILIAENPVELTDQSLTVTDNSTPSSTLKDIKDSPIKAISNIISNVFAKTSDEKELAADIVEIDFSEINNENNDKQKIAILTVTDTEKTDYQGSSSETLTHSTTESINTQAIEVVKVTKFEVTENGVSEIVEKEKNNPTSFSSNSELSIFDGVDSVSYNQVTAIADTKKQSAENQTASAEEETNESKTEKENAVVEVETIEVANVATEINKEEKDPIKASDSDTSTDDLATSIAKTEENASKITIKDLYDQLMTNLDENSVAKTEDVPTNTSVPEQITIKQLYQHINTDSEQVISDGTNSDTAISIAEKSELISTEPEENVAAVELDIDPDKSLAMVEQPDSDVKLDPVEEIIRATSSIKSTTPQAIDQTLENSEIQTASINTNPPTDNKGSTPLMIAALNSDLQSVRELVQQGVKINTRNDWGWTALLNASIKGNQELVNYLLKNGASPHLADNDGRSPLMAAVLNKHPKIVKALLNYKADVNKSNRDGWTALSFAAWNGDAKSVKYLLEANAFKHHLTSEGLTPLQLAKQGGHEEVIRLLNL